MQSLARRVWFDIYLSRQSESIVTSIKVHTDLAFHYVVYTGVYRCSSSLDRLYWCVKLQLILTSTQGNQLQTIVEINISEKCKSRHTFCLICATNARPPTVKKWKRFHHGNYYFWHCILPWEILSISLQGRIMQLRNLDITLMKGKNMFSFWVHHQFSTRKTDRKWSQSRKCFTDHILPCNQL